jgi:hypothetical protein
MTPYQIVEGKTVSVIDRSGRLITVTGWPESLPCPDCGGSLRWEEYGYVPGHMICSSCKSHWSSEGYEVTGSGGYVFEVSRAVFWGTD